MQTRILAVLGGESVAHATRRMMKKMVSDGVAREFNYRGKGAKHSFSALRLKGVICGMFITLIIVFGLLLNFLGLILLVH